MVTTFVSGASEVTGFNDLFTLPILSYLDQNNQVQTLRFQAHHIIPQESFKLEFIKAIDPNIFDVRKFADNGIMLPASRLNNPTGASPHTGGHTHYNAFLTQVLTDIDRAFQFARETGFSGQQQSDWIADKLKTINGLVLEIKTQLYDPNSLFSLHSADLDGDIKSKQFFDLLATQWSSQSLSFIEGWTGSIGGQPVSSIADSSFYKLGTQFGATSQLIDVNPFDAPSLPSFPELPNGILDSDYQFNKYIAGQRSNGNLVLVDLRDSTSLTTQAHDLRAKADGIVNGTTTNPDLSAGAWDDIRLVDSIAAGTGNHSFDTPQIDEGFKNSKISRAASGINGAGDVLGMVVVGLVGITIAQKANAEGVSFGEAADAYGITNSDFLVQFAKDAALETGTLIGLGMVFPPAAVLYGLYLGGEDLVAASALLKGLNPELHQALGLDKFDAVVGGLGGLVEQISDILNPRIFANFAAVSGGYADATQHQAASDGNGGTIVYMEMPDFTLYVEYLDPQGRIYKREYQDNSGTVVLTENISRVDGSIYTHLAYVDGDDRLTFNLADGAVVDQWVQNAGGDSILSIYGYPGVPGVVSVTEGRTDAQGTPIGDWDTRIVATAPVSGTRVVRGAASTPDGTVIGPWRTTIEYTEEYIEAQQQAFIEYAIKNNEGAMIGNDIGALFGSHIGQALAGDDVFAQVAAGSALSTVLANIGQTIGIYADNSNLTLSQSADIAFGDFSANLQAAFRDASIGAISSFLVSELFEGLGIDNSTIGGQLLSTATSSVTQTMLNNAVDVVAQTPGADLFNNLTNAANIAGMVGGFVGSYLAREVVSAETIGGSIGGAIGGAIGTSIGTGVALGTQTIIGSVGTGLVAGYGALAPLLAIPIIAVFAFVGTIIGTILGDRIYEALEGWFDDHGHGDAYAEITSGDGRFAEGYAGGQDADFIRSARDVRDATSRTINTILDMIGSENASGETLRIHIRHKAEADGVFGENTKHDYRFRILSEDSAGNETQLYERRSLHNWNGQQWFDLVTVQTLAHMELAGGNIYMQRALENSQATTVAGLFGDLQIANDYYQYLQNKPIIDMLIAIDPQSAFSAGWVITILRAEELRVHEMAASDFRYGLAGFLPWHDPARFGSSMADTVISVDGTALMLAFEGLDGVQNGTLRVENYAALTGFNRIMAQNATGGAGNDLWIAAAGAAASFIDGPMLLDNFSNDTLIGAELGDTIQAGVGQDFIQGREGNDTIDAGTGNDIIVGSEGNDTLQGGLGDDLFVYRRGDGSDTIADAGVAVQRVAEGTLAPIQEVVSIEVPDGDDTRVEHQTLTVGAVVNAGFDTLRLEAGIAPEDLIFAFDGSDLIIGILPANWEDLPSKPTMSQLTDKIRLANWLVENARVEVIAFANGLILDAMDILRLADPQGASAAQIYGQTVHYVQGTPGADMLATAPGYDIIFGGAGNDTIQGSAKRDIIDGGDGVDTVSYVGTEDDEDGVVANLSSGIASKADGARDTLIGIENLTGTSKDDQLTGNDAVNELRGGAGKDTLSGGAGNDLLHGDDGDDILSGGRGADNIHGGAGVDTLDYSTSTQAVTVSLATGTGLGGDAAGDTFSSIEKVIGSANGDTLYGSAGVDILVGGGGNDILAGGLGGDTLDGGTGVDTADYSASSAAVTINLTAGNTTAPAGGDAAGDTLENIENLKGSAFADTLTGGDGANELSGNGGNDVLSTGGGDDRLLGGDGDDLLDGGLGNDRLEGGSGTDALQGGGGNDSLFGGTGDDVLNGGAGADVLDGGDGVDVADYSGAAASVFADLETGRSFDQSSGQLLSIKLSGLPAGTLLSHGTANGDGSWTLTAEDYLKLTITPPSGSTGFEFSVSARLLEASGAVVERMGLIEGTTTNGVLSTKLKSISAIQTFEEGPSGWNSATLTDGGTAFSRFLGRVGAQQSTGLVRDFALPGFSGAVSVAFDFYEIDSWDNELFITLINGTEVGREQFLHSDLDNGHTSSVPLTTVLQNLGFGTYNDQIHRFSFNSSVTNETLQMQLRSWLNDSISDESYGIDNIRITMQMPAGAAGQSLQSLFATMLGGGLDQLTNVENLTGSAHADTLYGNAAANRIDGGAGNDIIIGRGGSDLLLGNTGDDTYLYSRGDGDDIIGDGSGVDRLAFGAGIAEADLVITVGKLNDPADPASFRQASQGEFQLDMRIQVLDPQTGELTGSVTVLDFRNLSNTNDLIRFANGSETTITALLASRGITDQPLVLGTTGNDTLTGTAANEIFLPLGGSNTLNGGDGDDIFFLHGGSGGVNGGNGTDMIDYLYATGAVNIALNGDDPDAYETTGPDNAANGLNYDLGAIENASGSVFNDFLYGNNGVNVLVGRAGNDLIQGVDGNDTLDGGDGNDQLYGEAHDDLLYGGAGNDTLDGGGQIDTMAGGTGDDTYVVDNAGDVVTEQADEGTDIVQSTITHALAANVENLTLIGSGSVNATGNALANIITGNAGANILDGGAGTDTLIGGAGNDTYVYNGVDSVVELAGQGTDTVQSALSYTLGDNVENLTLTGAEAVNGTGNALVNTITGNSANNVLDGGAGNDTMIGGLGDDTYIVDSASDVATEAASAGTDTVISSVTITALAANVENLVLTGPAVNGTGNALVNTITGNSADNALDGAAGTDTLIGGTGNDNYYVDNTGDVVTELAGEGWDTVYASASYTLSANTESIVLTGSVAINATGNTLDNYLTGNAGVNTLAGGAGNDIYIVQNTTDVVVELAAEGTDTIQSTVAYTLGANVENLTLTGSSSVAATGNAQNNQITGNAGANTLDGGAGADILTGGAGNDTYIVDDVGDVVVELDNEGTDTVQSTIDYTLGANVERLTLTGSAITAMGNALDNILTGNAGNNILDGGVGSDTIYGGDGNDVIHESSGNNTIYGGAGDDIFYVRGSTGGIDAAAGIDTLDYLYAAGAVYTVLAGDDPYAVETTGADYSTTGLVYHLNAFENASGSSFNDFLYGNSVANLLVGRTGNDVLTGVDGNDTLDGGEGNDTLYGGAHDDLLYGGAGNDVLDGGTQIDTMAGGTGNDTYIVDNAADVVTEADGEGFDTVQSTVTYTLAANVENLTLTGSGSVNATGNALANTITGNAGANILDGGVGIDTLIGGAGNDTYVFDGVDSLVELAGQGTDTVQSAFNYTLGDNVENLLLTGNAAVDGTGNALVNTITGNAANNVLDGGAGNDALIGGLGDDTYIVDSASDAVTEAASAGTDTVVSSVTITTLAANVERLTLSGMGAINGTGNALDNVITGNAAANTLSGAAGNDTLIGGEGNDIYIVDSAGDLATELAGEGWDEVQSTVTYTLSANVESLWLTGTGAVNGTGNALDNYLTGNSAANTLTGGAGNDVYIVQNTTDVVVELAGEGTDTVQSSVTYTLSANVENLTLTGTAAINAIGNVQGNVLIGNAAANILDGGENADTMSGAAGNDVYVVDHTGDIVVELANEGTDRIESYISYALGDNVENLTLIGNAAINGTSNALANTITGNAANNVLDGGAGNDTLIGGLGDDTYIVDSASDVVTEAASAGTDTVLTSVTITALAANVETLVLTGSVAINGTGNALANTISGNAADNTLDGGTGADTLIGGAGNDNYTVDNAGDVITELTHEGWDTIYVGVTYTLAANTESIVLTGSGAISATGNALDNYLTGNTGTNTLTGGAGNDVYFVQNTTDIVVELAGEGTDTVQSSVTYTLSANVENLTLTGTAAINAIGNALDNTLTGNSGMNTLDGGAGADMLSGGAGNDIYVVDNAGDIVVELANEGTDTVQSALGYTLGANVENLMLTGTAAINATGNTLVNVVTGNAADNILDGGAGNDTLIGGAGNDTYIVDSTSDVVTEAASAGTDTVLASATYTLGSNVENLTLTGTAAINATGNTLANLLVGNAGNNTISAGTGDDIIVAGAGNDTIDGGGNADTLTYAGFGAAVSINAVAGNATSGGKTDTFVNVETFIGTAFGDIFQGAAYTANTYNGGEGDDVFQMTGEVEDGDMAAWTVIGGAGIDTVDLSAVVSLDEWGVIVDLSPEYSPSYQSIERVIGSAYIDNLYGFTADETFFGGGGGDYIYGESGSDTLDGGAGSDMIDGGSGFDTASYASSAFAVDVDLATGMGRARNSGDSADQDVLIEIESVTGSAFGDLLTSARQGSHLHGASGDDMLRGGRGADILEGGIGDDVLIADATSGPIPSGIALGSGQIVKAAAAGASIATAVNISGAFSLDADPDIADATTIPHVSISATGGNHVDYYAVNIANAGSTIHLDIDYGWKSGSGSVDTMIRVLDASGNVLLYSYDWNSTEGAGGSTGTADPYMSYRVPAAGTYIIAVGTNSNFASVPSGVTYELQVSVSGELTGGLDDVLRGGSGNDTLESGLGNDLLDGGAGNDIYRFGAGDGRDIITDSGGGDLLTFGDLDPTSLWFAQQGSNLVISRLGSTDSVTIADWFASPASQIETIVSDDGSRVLHASDVNSLISQMAAFSAQVGADPSAVQASALPPEYQVAVNSVWTGS